MKLFAIALSSLMISSLAFAGGVICKQCPAESTQCIPKAGCEADTVVCSISDTNVSHIKQSICEGTPENTEFFLRASVVTQAGDFCGDRKLAGAAPMNCQNDLVSRSSCVLVFSCR